MLIIYRFAELVGSQTISEPALNDVPVEELNSDRRSLLYLYEYHNSTSSCNVIHQQNEVNYYDQFIDETIEEDQFVDNIESLYDATMNGSAMEVFPDSEMVDIVEASIESCGMEVASSEVLTNEQQQPNPGKFI